MYYYCTCFFFWGFLLVFTAKQSTGKSKSKSVLDLALFSWFCHLLRCELGMGDGALGIKGVFFCCLHEGL